jgi:hypothetical protein
MQWISLLHLPRFSTIIRRAGAHDVEHVSAKLKRRKQIDASAAADAFASARFVQ